MQIVGDDGTVYTMMETYEGLSSDNYTINGSCTKVVTDALGSFSFKILNDSGMFLNKFNGGETVIIYADADTADTEIFRGKIDNVKYGVNTSDGFFMNIEGRDYAEFVDILVTGIEAATTADISLASLLYYYFSDVTLTYWNGSAWVEATYDELSDTVTWSASATGFPTTLMNMSYEQRKGWSVIGEICNRAGLDCYPHYDGTKWTLRTFLIESIINTNTGISYGINLLSLSEYGLETSEVINSVSIYGKTEGDNILLLKTEEDAASQMNLWKKQKVINDGSLSTMEDVQSRADFELVQGTNNDSNGRMESLMLYNLSPGELISISVPYCNIYGNYKVHSYTHNFDYPLTTQVELTKKLIKIKDLFVPKLNASEFLSNLTNPNNMKDSYTVYFNENPSSMTLSGCEENNGQLRLESGVVSGQATSDFITADYDVTQCELRRYENFETTNDTYDVTNTGGNTWETYTATEGNIHTFSVDGREIGFRLNLNRLSSTATSPAYESVCLLYR
jgi:hypothetical protein